MNYQGLDKLAEDYQVSQEDIELLDRYLKFFIEKNKEINLTRITSLDEGYLLHLEDSLTVLPEIHDAPNGLYGDLGTGGGFPGVPLAVVSNRKTVLIDSTTKKIQAVREVVNKAGIERDIEFCDCRIEEIPSEFKNSFSVLTARALSALASLLELAVPLLTIGGQLICLKAAIDDEEINRAVVLEEKLGMKLIKDRKLLLSDSETQRRILVFEKYKEPEIALPRRTGMAQKKPL